MIDSMPSQTRLAAAKIIEEKRDALLTERNQLAQERHELLQRTRRNDRELADCKAAARLFDLQIDFPLDEREEMDRQLMLRRAESEARDADYLRRARERRAALEATHRLTEIEKPSTLIEAMPATVMSASHHSSAQADAGIKKTRPPLRVVVLDQLKASGSTGAKAATIRDYIERTFGEVLHEKTVGMTLYRLLKENLARRDGHIWFLATSEAKNPGGEMPGQSLLED